MNLKKIISVLVLTMTVVSLFCTWGSSNSPEEYGQITGWVRINSPIPTLPNYQNYILLDGPFDVTIIGYDNNDYVVINQAVVGRNGFFQSLPGSDWNHEDYSDVKVIINGMEFWRTFDSPTIQFQINIDTFF